MMWETIRVKVRSYVLRNFVFEEKDSVGDDRSLFKTGSIDSTGIFEVNAFAENEFHIRFDESELVADNFDTIDRVTNCVVRKMGLQASRTSSSPPRLKLANRCWHSAGKKNQGALCSKEMIAPHCELDRRLVRAKNFGKPDSQRIVLLFVEVSEITNPQIYSHFSGFSPPHMPYISVWSLVDRSNGDHLVWAYPDNGVVRNIPLHDHISAYFDVVPDLDSTNQFRARRDLHVVPYHWNTFSGANASDSNSRVVENWTVLAYRCPTYEDPAVVIDQETLSDFCTAGDVNPPFLSHLVMQIESQRSKKCSRQTWL
jgi:acyl carrier protein